jgi:glycosyltransferase involved in cell wall biosynthesis
MPVAESRDRLRRLARLLRPRVLRELVASGVVHRATRHRSPIDGSGVAEVVIVNWNTLPYLQVALAQLRRFWYPGMRVLVIDNGSTDGSDAYLRETELCESILLRRNAGHATALDWGFLTSHAEFVVALDVDAFPIDAAWLDAVLEPLRHGARVAGAHLHREYVHPCFMALRTRSFREGRHSFQPAGFRGRSSGLDRLDTGEKLSLRERERLSFLEPTETRGPGCLGTTFGNVVYHNFYTSRHRHGARPLIDGLVHYADTQAAWLEALERFGAEPATTDVLAPVIEENDGGAPR